MHTAAQHSTLLVSGGSGRAGTVSYREQCLHTVLTPVGSLWWFSWFFSFEGHAVIHTSMFSFTQPDRARASDVCARVLGPADRFHTEHANSRGTRTTRKRFRTVSGRDRRCPLAHGKHQIVSHSLTARWAARNGSGQWLDSRKFLSGQMASPALR